MTDSWVEGKTAVTRLPNGVLHYNGWPLGEPDDQEFLRQERERYASHSGVKKVPAERPPQDPPAGSIPAAAAPLPRTGQQGFVYFLHDPGTDWVKIGFTANPEQRLK